jgi:hypothetical protein
MAATCGALHRGLEKAAVAHCRRSTAKRTGMAVAA